MVSLAKKLFPSSAIIIDKYHYVRQVIWAIDAARKRIQQSEKNKNKKIYFNCRKLISKRKEDLNDEALKRLDAIFWNSSELANAYELKEMFFRIMDEENLKLKEKMLS